MPPAEPGKRSSLKILPAVDLRNGRCVRLRQGLAREETVYAMDPVEAARTWEQAGAEYLHVVDLDGAFAGRPVHRDTIAGMARALSIPVEVGGGIRTRDQIRDYLEEGLDRVILGTRACEDPESLSALTAEFGEHLAVGIDARDGRVQVRGWTETTACDALDLARRLAERGVRTLIYTDTARDGMMQGVNVEAMGAMCRAFAGRVIASGGVTRTRDVAALAALGHPNLAGVIVGKALYEGAVTLSGLQAAARGEGHPAPA